MFRINGTTITLTQGDSFYAVVSLTEMSTGHAYTPQEGDVIKFGLKKSITDAECVIEKTIPNGTLLLYLAPSDTKELPLGNYVYDIELTTAGGDVDTFINKATFVLVAEVLD